MFSLGSQEISRERHDEFLRRATRSRHLRLVEAPQRGELPEPTQKVVPLFGRFTPQRPRLDAA